ncbi:MAG: PDZ domain-containing protein [Puniceicoccales bacterium]|jgi:hypothetical protein|nr:PDZ domain-containing protein [Puniceicoccales bacterium]
MNKHLRTIPLHMLFLTGLLPALSAADNPNHSKEAAPKPTTTCHNNEATPVAFLGVETAPADDATRRRLKLVPETGLRIHVVAQHSPASKKLQPGDVLVGLDAQILCNNAQLRTLVRGKKPGDTISLKFFRDGASMEEKLTLGTIPATPCINGLPCHPSFLPKIMIKTNSGEIPLRDLINERMTQWHDGSITIDPESLKEIPENILKRMEEIQTDLRQHADKVRARINSKILKKSTSPNTNKDAPAPDKNTGQASTEDHHIQSNYADTVIHDNEGSASLTNRNGALFLKLQDTKGRILFEGSVDTPEQRKALPEQAAQRLEMLEQLHKDSTPHTAE